MDAVTLPGGICSHTQTCKKWRRVSGGNDGGNDGDGGSGGNDDDDDVVMVVVVVVVVILNSAQEVRHKLWLPCATFSNPPSPAR